jgi:hypothetical protein
MQKTTRTMATYDVRAGDVPRHLFRSGRVKFSLNVPVSTPKERRASRKDMPDVHRRKQMELLREHFAWDILHAIHAYFGQSDHRFRSKLTTCFGAS